MPIPAGNRWKNGEDPCRRGRQSEEEVDKIGTKFGRGLAHEPWKQTRLLI